jgi:hypothetical protein
MESSLRDHTVILCGIIDGFSKSFESRFSSPYTRRHGWAEIVEHAGDLPRGRCAVCMRYLGKEGARGRERRCDACTPRPHRVYVILFSRNAWIVNFVDLIETIGRSAHAVTKP